MKMIPAALLAGVLSLCMPAMAGATELRLRFQGPDQSKTSVEKAEIILTGWGWIETIDLIPDGNTVSLNFESLAAQFPDKFRNLDRAQLYIRAANMAPVQSEPFVWPGAAETTIDFRDGRSAAIRIGTDQEKTVTMRRPQTRQIRLQDEAGKPIAGLKLSVYRFESSSNHCGFLWGEDLKVGSSDANGRVVVPDGDFKYAINLGYGSHYDFISLAPSGSFLDSFVTVLLTQPETVLRLHRLEAVRLALRVSVGNVQAAGVSFTDSRNIGTCGAASGILGKTGSDGRLLVERYYPEERDGICIVDDKKQLLWGKESAELLQISRNPIEIRLPAGTTFGQLDTPCPFP